MAFEVREFDFEAREKEFLWKFTLGNPSLPPMDFQSQDASTRSLLHLAQDLSTELDAVVGKKNKRAEHSERCVRKLTEKSAKSLKVSLSGLSADLQEQKQDLARGRCVHADQRQMQEVVGSHMGKHFPRGFFTLLLQRNLLFLYLYSTQLSLSPTQFYTATDHYMRSYCHHGKRLSPDFELLNELYVVALAQQHPQPTLPERNLPSNALLLDINLNIEDKYISEAFLWDQDNLAPIKIDTFITQFLADTLTQHELRLDPQTFAEYERDARVQLRTQILYKSLLKKYAGILLNFSTMEIPSEIKEYLITIELKLSGQNDFHYEDRFEWDILNESNDIEKFVKTLMEDSDISRQYTSQICYKIRTQINLELQWKFNLLGKTFRSIHRERESPKLNTQTISVLRKNVTYTMDVSLPYSDEHHKLTPNIFFNNSDLFSLLSRHMDILPEEFQEVLMCKEAKEKQTPASKKAKAEEYLRKNRHSMESNPYLSNQGNFYNLHNIWKRSLSR